MNKAHNIRQPAHAAVQLGLENNVPALKNNALTLSL
jgi:hypothetical protein